MWACTHAGKVLRRPLFALLFALLFVALQRPHCACAGCSVFVFVVLGHAFVVVFGLVVVVVFVRSRLPSVSWLLLMCNVCC